MVRAKEDATKSTQGLDYPSSPEVDTPNFQQASIERQAIKQQFGSVRTKLRIAESKQVITGVTNQNTDDKKQPMVYKRNIDINNFRIKSTMTVKGKSCSVRVIVPTKNNCTWMSTSGVKHLTLINSNGDIIKESIVLGDTKIQDAKSYDNDVLVICQRGKTVVRMSGDGKKASTFSNLQEYYTIGLCVTHGMDVLVCLIPVNKQENPDNMVVRLGRTGNILQTIQYNKSGEPLFRAPGSVTSLPTGEILVTNLGATPGVVYIDKDGQHLFTFTGDTEERFRPNFITYDNDNNICVTDYNSDRVYVIRRDGTKVTCLSEYTHGIDRPLAIAIDDNGQLLVGCWLGKIHVIEY